jgi:TRAP-type C4-dicarboxylate transport system permease small subunit
MIALAQETAKLENPIGSIGSVPELLASILNVLLIVAMPIIVLYLIYAGFQYVIARGKPEELQKANRSIMYGLIGAVIVVGAFAILEIITNLVDQF